MGCRDGRKAAFNSFPSTKLIAIVKLLFNTAVQLLPVSHRFPSHDQVKMCLTRMWICCFVHNKLITRRTKLKLSQEGKRLASDMSKHSSLHLPVEQSKKGKIHKLVECHLLQNKKSVCFFVTLHLEPVCLGHKEKRKDIWRRLNCFTSCHEWLCTHFVIKEKIIISYAPWEKDNM